MPAGTFCCHRVSRGGGNKARSLHRHARGHCITYDAKGNDCEKPLDQKGNHQSQQDRRDVVDRFWAETELIRVLIVSVARRCQVEQQLRNWLLHQRIPEIQQGRDQGYKKDFQHGIRLHGAYASEGLGPVLGGLDKKRAESTAHYTNNDEAQEFEVFPINQIPDLKHDNLMSAIRIEKLE